jgi:histidyl-tRNA synthetase
VDLPAVGFGMGDVVLGELLKERGLLPIHAPHLDCYLAVVTLDDLPLALQLTAHLRDAGLSVEYSLRELALGKQLKQADARGARLGLVVGPEDREQGRVQLKDFAERQQHAVAIDHLVDHCRELISRED